MDGDVNKSASHSIGLDIVRSLTGQVDGKLSYVNANGSNFTITFPSTGANVIDLTTTENQN